MGLQSTVKNSKDDDGARIAKRRGSEEELCGFSYKDGNG